MLLAVDQRKKLLKRLRLVNHEAFQRVCTLLDISYSFPPEYYRPATRRWLAKKALCMKVRPSRPRPSTPPAPPLHTPGRGSLCLTPPLVLIHLTVYLWY